MATDVKIYFNDQELEFKSYLMDTDFVIEVKNVPTNGQLTINCQGKDIESRRISCTALQAHRLVARL